MELSKYIKEILISKDNVIIPNFGAFEKIMLTARIDPITGEMHPPQIGIEFKSDIKIDSGILVKYIAENESIGEDKVAEEIQGQVKIWEDTLNQGQQVLISGIGIITKDSSGNLNYESTISSSDFPDSYGLPVISIKDKKGIPQIETPKKEIVPEQKIAEQKKVDVKKAPVKQKETIIAENSESKKVNKKLIIALVIAVPLIALIAVVVLNYNQAKSKFGDATKYVSGLFSSKSSKDTTNTKSIVITDSLKSTDTSNAETKEILENYTIIDGATNSKISPDSQALSTIKKVFIISGSFKTKSFANRQRNILVKKGFKAEVLPENKGLFRVAVASFDDVPSAAKDFDRIKSIDESLTYWILVDK